MQNLYNQQAFAGFLMKSYFDDNLQSILPSASKYYLPMEVEAIFKMAAQTFNSQAILVERIDDYVCFSEIDF